MPNPTPLDEAPLADEAPIPHVERKAIALLLVVACLIAGFVTYVLYARGVFESTQTLVLVADDAEGALVGMDLTFSGFPIGRVSRIELAPDGKARLLVEVPHKDAHWLRSSSIFTMERGLVGETKIRAFTGIMTDPALPDGAERTVLRGDSTAEIPRLVASARGLLSNLEAMTSADSSINTSLANLRGVTDKLQGRYGMLSLALGSDAEAKKVIQTLDRTNALLAQADQRVFGKKGLVDDSQAAVAELTGLLQDTRSSLKKVDAVLAEAQAVGANARIATTDLGPLRTEVEINLRKVTQLVDEINRKWPFAKDTELKLP